MTRDETARILAIIGATYPNFKILDKSATLDAWYFFLQDFKAEEIGIALKTFVRTSGSGFPPSVDQLIAMTQKPVELTRMNEMEAWALVSKAICNSTYNSAEEFERLPEMVQKAVGSPQMLKSWASTDLKTIETVIASNFQRTFRSVQHREEEIAKMPEEIRNRIGTMTSGLLEG